MAYTKPDLLLLGYVLQIFSTIIISFIEIIHNFDFHVFKVTYCRFVVYMWERVDHFPLELNPVFKTFKGIPLRKMVKCLTLIGRSELLLLYFPMSKNISLLKNIQFCYDF